MIYNYCYCMKNNQKLSICILAGGNSSRMGQNKALMFFQGQPLIKRVVERVSSLSYDIYIISNDAKSYEFLKLPIVLDKVKGAGVMGGLFTALSMAPSLYVAVVACDLPNVNINLINAELDIAQAEFSDVVIPESKNGLEPLHALYRRATCLPYVQQALDTGQKKLISWFDHVRVRVISLREVAEFDPGGTAFININTPEDLSRAQGMDTK